MAFILACASWLEVLFGFSSGFLKFVVYTIVCIGHLLT